MTPSTQRKIAIASGVVGVLVLFLAIWQRKRLHEQLQRRRTSWFGKTLQWLCPAATGYRLDGEHGATTSMRMNLSTEQESTTRSHSPPNSTFHDSSSTNITTPKSEKNVAPDETAKPREAGNMPATESSEIKTSESSASLGSSTASVSEPTVSGSTATPGEPITGAGPTATPGEPTTASASTANPGEPTTGSGPTAAPGEPATGSASTAAPPEPTAGSGLSATPGEPATGSGSTATPGEPTTGSFSTGTPGFATSTGSELSANDTLSNPENTQSARSPGASSLRLKARRPESSTDELTGDSDVLERHEMCDCQAVRDLPEIEDFEAVFEDGLVPDVRPTYVLPVQFSPYRPLNLTEPDEEEMKQDLSPAAITLGKKSHSKTNLLTPFRAILHCIVYASKHGYLIKELADNYSYLETS
ncbi:unnamed protein product [Bursaphelenchus xylophilus]|uniref:(pine wood nematode) hypothetical protein n=1 Tax=Bursaphelenchus xylophilus TaxID=6326 RepID=A0A1I7S672_BURXY|nr:unnamed protein product [Bursaphelenchus xylophilus]CAG9081067.1 unnamed protein product [Bursaphelenchus xylophilus]